MEISIESAEEKFTAHLTQTDNDRILFSGKFGTGKSYFLRKYFDKRDDKYNYIWLSPVNYVVGANQDIFEWIKIDIAKELLNKEAFSKDKENFNDNLILQTFLYNNVSTIFSRLVELVLAEEVKAKTTLPIIDTLKQQITAYKKYRKKIRKQDESDEENILEFLNDAFQEKGSIFEDNLTTQIIRTSIQFLDAKSEKPTVLVIDDLDRLDPEHVFRILNIFSVHNDHFDSNKFGFDKVIVVSDIDNIESLYRHKYGEKTDFDGYIEKFYTYEPFYFTNIDSIVEYCSSSFIVNNIDDDNRTVLKILLVEFYKRGYLKIRNLKKISTNVLDFTLFNIGIKYYHVEFNPQKHTHLQGIFYDKNEFAIDFDRFDIIKVIYLCSLAFGGLQHFINALAKLRGVNEPFEKKHLTSIINSIALLKHIAINTPEHRLFYIFENTNPGHSYTIQECPKFSILGISAEMKLGWSHQNPYNGKVDYFKNVQLSTNFFENYSHNQVICRINYLADEINTIIPYLTKNNILKNKK